MDNKDIMNAERSNNDEMALPSIKQEENNEWAVLPQTEENSEPINAQTQTLDPQVDFSSIFNVASEEAPVDIPEVKEEAPSELSSVQPPVTETPELTVEQKTTPTFNKDQFNSEEKILYEIKPEKEGNPIIVLLFFIFLIGFIILLPVISKKYDTFKPTSTQPEEVVEEESTMYELGSTAVRVKIGDIELNNFVSAHIGEDNYLTFTLTNSSAQPYTFNKKYYIVLYEGNVNRGYALIHDYDIVSAYGAQEVNLIISDAAYNRADHFTVEEINPNRYPVVSTTKTEGEYDLLICSYKNDEMKYYLSNNSLVKIVETYHETQGSTANYETNKTKYKNASERYKQIEGFTSTFIETVSDFTMINEIELVNIQDKTLSDLQVYRYFKYSEDKNTISFELQAQGYKCS